MKKHGAGYPAQNYSKGLGKLWERERSAESGTKGLVIRRIKDGAEVNHNFSNDLTKLWGNTNDNNSH